MDIAVLMFIMCLLLFGAALISASEAAFFSLDPVELDQLRKSESRSSQIVLELLEKPKRLLATQLIGINFLNIGAVVISEYIMDELFDFSANPTLGFVVQVIA